MDNFRRLQSEIAVRLTVILGLAIALSIGAAWSVSSLWHPPAWIVLTGGTILSFVLSSVIAALLTPLLLEPVRLLWQAILHVSPNTQALPAPNLEAVRLGRELVTSLTMQVYQLAQHDFSDSGLSEHRRQIVQAANIVSNLPLPMFVCNKQQLVTNASNAGLDYCHIESSKLFGKPLFDSLNLEFGSDMTLEAWMNDCQKNKVTDRAYWERVRVRLPDEERNYQSSEDKHTLRQCDMAAYFNRDNPSGTEFIVTLFDRTERYEQDDKALSFVALAVHELRTPLTILRGYIEVFEEELTPVLNPEMKDFMFKMEVSAEQLTGFINNILNVARVEDNQLVLHLAEENWETILRKVVTDTELRAKVHGKSIKLQIDGPLPSVGADSVSIYEVVSNLLDNAIKYSADSPEIEVASRLGKDGLVETTVTDHGVGIPSSILPNLFEKFYRNHRTRGQIGGTGLGLYLSKAIVKAHGGQIWAQSKEGEGSTFGFSLQPYAQLAEELKTGNNTDITRAAHGWVKNHSLYRR